MTSRLISTDLCRKGWVWVTREDVVRLQSWPNYTIPGLVRCDRPVPRILWSIKPLTEAPSGSSPMMSNLFPGCNFLLDKGLMWETLAGYARQMSPRCAANVAGGLLPFTYRLYDQRECEHFFRTHMAPQNNDDVVSSRGGVNVKDGEACWGGAAQGPGGMGVGSRMEGITTWQSRSKGSRGGGG
eukprot:jgi/Mesvir1/8620/Mv06902-RA.1